MKTLEEIGIRQHRGRKDVYFCDKTDQVFEIEEDHIYTEVKGGDWGWKMSKDLIKALYLKVLETEKDDW